MRARTGVPAVRYQLAFRLWLFENDPTSAFRKVQTFLYNDQNVNCKLYRLDIGNCVKRQITFVSVIYVKNAGRFFVGFVVL